MSNIDTKSIVSQLMAIERRPQDLLKNKVAGLQQAQTAWGAIGDKLTALKTAAEALAPTGSATKLVSATSDDSTTVGVRATGAVTGSTSVAVEVDHIATAHSVVMTDTFTGSTASAGGRGLDVTIGGTLHSFTSDDGSIGGLARAVNAAGLGVSARVLQTGTGTYQLALSANKTGAASAFTVGATGWAGSTVARTGADAQFSIDGVTLTRASNTVSDVIDGIEITLKGKTSGQVTVSAARDDDGVVAKVKSLVDAANSVLSAVSAQTASSTNAASRGTLAGDNTARQTSDMVRNFVAKGITSADGSVVPSSKLGISLTKEGTLSFDETALRSTLTTDPQTVFNSLGRGGSSSIDGVKVTNVSAAAVDGPRTVTVTAAATQANMVGVPSPPPPAGATVALTVVTPTGSYSVSFTAGSSYAETAAHLTAALRGLGVKASAGTTQTGGIDDGFKIVADKYGAGHLFSVSGAGAATLGLTNPATDGTDAQATITTNGVSHSYTASGQSLVKEGVALTFDLTPDQLAAAGGSVTSTVKVTGGLAGGLSAIGGQGSSTGLVASAKDSLTTRISDLQSRISKWDDMLSKRQTTLEARFTNMQMVLNKLQSALSSSGISSLATG